MRRPLRRSEDLIVEAVADELLVYDRTNHRAHCLSATAASVWQACDGSSDLVGISAQLGLPLDVIRQAVDELEASQLFDQGLEVVSVGSANGNGKGVTRREMAVRSARLGAAAVSAPLIVSIVAPIPTAAATPTEFQCGVYTAGSCGTGSGCAQINGCCCCCPNTTGSCKWCAPTSLCTTFTTQTCPVPFGSGQGGCSATGQPGAPDPTANGCCGTGVGANTNSCACGYNSNGATTQAGPGSPGGPNGGGAGCCDITLPVAGTTPPNQQFQACTPGNTNNCVPCCNGFPIAEGSVFECCPNVANSNSIGTCVAGPPN